jgi:hypothetical protein
MSTQRCDKCDMRFSAVSTGLAPKKRKRVMMDPFTGRPVHREWGERSGLQPRWSLSMRLAWGLCGLAFVGVCALVLYFSLRGGRTESATYLPAPGAGMLAGEFGPDSSAYESMKSKFELGAEMAKKVLDATTVEELLPMIRNREIIESRLRRFYETEGGGTLPIGYSGIAPINHHTWVEKQRLVIITYANKDRFVRAIAFEERADGTLLADWPSLVALCEVPVEGFLRDKETRPRQFRLLARFDDYYNHDFSSELEFVCMRLTDITGKHSFYGYARRNSDAGRSIMNLRLPAGRGFVLPMTLCLRFPDDARQPDQTEITSFVTNGWVLPAEKEPLGAPSGTVSTVRPAAPPGL